MSRVERDLIKAVTDSATESVSGAAVSLVRGRDWSSSLFSGVRLTVEIKAGEDEAFETWLADLPEAEFAVRGYFVASADLVERNSGIAVVEFLLVEES
ncbi:hypothetical protein [Sphingomonas pruni]|uniref:hypothetical protein n=1 Tax=Sphingomonas pruni TaxID=40683 RepID=UPI00082E9916|nr:hypothetical protein [Sphingomonas pruni]